jgi:hypothetical protein
MGTGPCLDTFTASVLWRNGCRRELRVARGPRPCAADDGVTGRDHPAVMPPNDQHADRRADRRAAQARTRALLRAAAAAYPFSADQAAAWLHAPHTLLLGATPAAAAWSGERLAAVATLLLLADSARARVQTLRG